jgi:hypothetical protein
MSRSISIHIDPQMAREEIDAFVERQVRYIALSILEGVVEMTPVDTGRARSNWHVSLNAPNLATKEPYAPGVKGSTGKQNAGAAVEAGAVTISDAPAYGSIWISNGLPYIGKLESGHSGQAPSGMVAITLDRVIARVSAAAAV